MSHNKLGKIISGNGVATYTLRLAGGKHSRDIRLRRVGWGAARLIDKDSGLNELESGLFGLLPGQIQTVPRAELFGMLEVLRKLVEVGCRNPVVLWVDVSYLTLGFGRGLWRIQEFSNPDLWESFWELHGSLLCRFTQAMVF